MEKRICDNRWTKRMSSCYDFLLAHPYIFCCIVFFLMILINLDKLPMPPFGDEIAGVHKQAVWLSKNQFKGWLLWCEAELPQNGGAGCYPFSFVPYVIGVCYAIMPVTAVHVTARLLSLLFASICILCFFKISQVEKIDKRIAFTAAIAFILYPIFSGQSISAGQEMEIAAFIMLSLLCFFHDRTISALLWAFAACFIKPVAVILLLAYFLYFLFLWIRSKMLQKRRALLLSLIFTALIKIVYSVVPNHMSFSASLHPSSFLSGVFTDVLFHCRYFFSHFLIFLLIALLLFIVSLSKKEADKHIISGIFLAGMLTVGFFAAYFLQTDMAKCPRYAVIVVFPAAVMFVLCLKAYPVRIQLLILIAFSFLNVVNLNGDLLPAIPVLHSGNGACYERSREYFRVIRAHKQLVSSLEHEKDNMQYVCIIPLTRILTMPEMGYVKEPFPRVISEDAYKYAPIKKLSSYDKTKPVCLIADYPANPPFVPLPPPEKLRMIARFPVKGISPYCGAVIYDFPELAQIMQMLKDEKK